MTNIAGGMGAVALGVGGAVSSVLVGGSLALYNKIFEEKHKPKILTENILKVFTKLHELGLDQSQNLILIGKLFLLDLGSLSQSF